MRNKRIAILAGAAALLAAGAAQATTAETQRMHVALPGGSVAQIEYVGDVAPTVTVLPAERRVPRPISPFAEMERIAAAMEARHRAMMRQMAALQQFAAQAAVAPRHAPGLTLVGNLPAGSRYTVVSSSTDASGCTRTVRYSSDGSSNAAPVMSEVSSSGCDRAAPPAAAAPGLEV